MALFRVKIYPARPSITDCARTRGAVETGIKTINEVSGESVERNRCANINRNANIVKYGTAEHGGTRLPA